MYHMKQREIIKAALKNNRPLLLLGKAGTAKTATVNAVADELGLPVVVLPLAGISPEDIGGMPRPNDPTNPTAFRYLAPEWFEKHRNKDFVLFLDEFNQASIDTMHAMFYLVNDRMTAGQKNPKMRIVAAGNTANQNQFLTPIPEPLLDRFVYQLEWKGDLDSSLDYLKSKYNKDGKLDKFFEAINLSAHSDVTPRHIEQAIFMIQDKVLDPVRGQQLIGSAWEVYHSSLDVKEKHAEDNRLKYLEEVKQKLSQGEFAIVDGCVQHCDKSKLLETLTDEEKELLGVA